jgi:hypothetical protein
MELLIKMSLVVADGMKRRNDGNWNEKRKASVLT